MTRYDTLPSSPVTALANFFALAREAAEANEEIPRKWVAINAAIALDNIVTAHRPRAAFREGRMTSWERELERWEWLYTCGHCTREQFREAAGELGADDSYVLAVIGPEPEEDDRDAA